MQHRPRVSTIIPIYNAERFLDQCLESVRSQTYDDIEIICINDGSSDRSIGIVENHAAYDARIVCIDKENEGYGATCNRGIAAAQGDYIAIVEPDDYILPTMYEDMLAFGDSFPDTIDVIKTSWLDVEEWNDLATEHTAPGYLFKRLKNSTKPQRLADMPILIETHPAIWSALYRKGFLDDNGIRFKPYPGAGWADNPFLIETLCRACSIVYLDRMYYCYRRDLPDPTRSHTSDAAIALPFDRWLEMTALLDEIGITDKGIWEAHYLRGFNYIDCAIIDDGWGNQLVQKKTKEICRSMMKETVLGMRKLSPDKKNFFLDQVSQPRRCFSPLPYYRHLCGELANRIHVYGLGGAAKNGLRFVLQKTTGSGIEKIERAGTL